MQFSSKCDVKTRKEYIFCGEGTYIQPLTYILITGTLTTKSLSFPWGLGQGGRLGNKVLGGNPEMALVVVTEDM